MCAYGCKSACSGPEGTLVYESDIWGRQMLVVQDGSLDFFPSFFFLLFSPRKPSLDDPTKNMSQQDVFFTKGGGF
ncbi:hypothetical protein M406DRAFT_101978 [Cryphonectria parasitica EP155]|uniref:Uncharacterized protein n=1 Tax=Cryphonectria parasitica (strain ATCC 38755 / EP155) TaxID=660469 RepID=A0A9P5CRT3_CRYP1|nr:uncharacterized protein M406DRAFT_101978 [Cryphonectria parasitica EP155]KAF3767435.1 hypothetical protein M406DRAFT_101978 [Cryphonectria parasitica EP155]